MSRTLEAAFDRGRKGLTTFREEDAALRRSIEAIDQQLRDLRQSPIPEVELRERIRAHLVEPAGEAWLQDVSPQLRQITVRSARVAVVTSTPKRRFDQSPALGTWEALCALDPDAAVDQLFAAIQRAGYVPGLTKPDYEAEERRLKAELLERQTLQEQLVDDAIAAGIPMEHRPDVVFRKAEEAAKREREERKAAASAKRQQRVDAAHADRVRRTGRSGYLSSISQKLDGGPPPKAV